MTHTLTLLFLLILTDYVMETVNKMISKDDLKENFTDIESQDTEITNTVAIKNKLMQKQTKSVRDYLFIFPIIYFFTAISLLFLLVLFNVVQKKNRSKMENYPLQNFPIFFSLPSINNHFYFIAVLMISASGIINACFFLFDVITEI